MNRTSCISLVCLLACLVGCAATAPPATVDPTRLPADPAALADFAATRLDPNGPVEAIHAAYEAAAKGVGLAPRDERLNALAARSALWLLEFDDHDNNRDRAALAAQGCKYAEVALAADPDSAEYHFLAGALLGMKIAAALAPSMIDIGRVHGHFTSAYHHAPNLDQGAPGRALGMLLVRAPVWPVSVGDAERGLEILERTDARFPDFPANPLYLAQAYQALGKLAAADEALARCRRLLVPGAWGARGPVWRREADRVARKLVGP